MKNTLLSILYGGGVTTLDFTVRVVFEGATFTLEFNDSLDGSISYDLTVTTEPWLSRGSWPVAVSRNSYETTTISLVLPLLSGSVVIGESPTFAAGLYGTALTGATTYTLQVDAVNVAGFVGVSFATLASYTNTAGDLTMIELHDGVAVHTSAALTIAAASYTETSATANKAARLTGAANFAADNQTALFALSFNYTKITNANGMLFGLAGTSLDFAFAAAEIRTRVWDSDTGVLINLDTAVIPINSRVNALIALDSNGTSTFVMSVDGAAWSTEWTSTNTSTALNLDGALGIMSDSGGSQTAPIIHYRTAAWVGITLPDVTSGAVQSNFFSGGTLVDPATSITAYGTPVIDVYGNAATLNAGTNNGSYNGGTAFTVTGTFT
jgi:hypothetical protein